MPRHRRNFRAKKHSSFQKNHNNKRHNQKLKHLNKFKHKIKDDDEETDDIITKKFIDVKSVNADNTLKTDFLDVKHTDSPMDAISNLIQDAIGSIAQIFLLNDFASKSFSQIKKHCTL